MSTLACDETLDAPWPIECDPASSPPAKRMLFAAVLFNDYHPTVMNERYLREVEQRRQDLQRVQEQLGVIHERLKEQQERIQRKAQAPEDEAPLDPPHGSPQEASEPYAPFDEILQDIHEEEETQARLEHLAGNEYRPEPYEVFEVKEYLRWHADKRRPRAPSPMPLPDALGLGAAAALPLPSEPPSLRPRLFVWLEDLQYPLTCEPAVGNPVFWRGVAADSLVYFLHERWVPKRLVIACVGVSPQEVFLYLCHRLQWHQREDAHARRRIQANWIIPGHDPLAPRRGLCTCRTHRGVMTCATCTQSLRFVRFDVHGMDRPWNHVEQQRILEAGPRAVLQVLSLEDEPRAFFSFGVS